MQHTEQYGAQSLHIQLGMGGTGPQSPMLASGPGAQYQKAGLAEVAWCPALRGGWRQHMAPGPILANRAWQRPPKTESQATGQTGVGADLIKALEI